MTVSVFLGSEEGMIPTLKRNLSGSLLVLQVSPKPLSSQALMIKFWRKITKEENVRDDAQPH